MSLLEDVMLHENTYHASGHAEKHGSLSRAYPVVCILGAPIDTIMRLGPIQANCIQYELGQIVWHRSYRTASMDMNYICS